MCNWRYIEFWCKLWPVLQGGVTIPPSACQQSIGNFSIPFQLLSFCCQLLLVYSKFLCLLFPSDGNFLHSSSRNPAVPGGAVSLSSVDGHGSALPILAYPCLRYILWTSLAFNLPAFLSFTLIQIASGVVWLWQIFVYFFDLKGWQEVSVVLKTL